MEDQNIKSLLFDYNECKFYLRYSVTKLLSCNAESLRICHGIMYKTEFRVRHTDDTDEVL